MHETCAITYVPQLAKAPLDAAVSKVQWRMVMEYEPDRKKMRLFWSEFCIFGSR